MSVKVKLFHMKFDDKCVLPALPRVGDRITTMEHDTYAVMNVRFVIGDEYVWITLGDL